MRVPSGFYHSLTFQLVENIRYKVIAKTQFTPTKQLNIQGTDRQLITQINEQQYEYLKPNTAQERIHLKFKHPRGKHDDQLYALTLACYASKETEPAPAYS